ncbi:Aldolase-type TIM barrel family protein [Abeliophyllum distichum]|uniref:ribulose-phosphate 3-epimerase n=1 Tax=Abeliophyllum distichum TaxID=126358 RepID=A0ABD1SY89_9LAMI
MVKPKIAPSMLSSDFANLASEAERMLRCGADWLHMDIMDGYVGYSGSRHIWIATSWSQILLITVEPLGKAGASGFTFHVEASKDNWKELVQLIKSKGMTPGVSLKPGTPIEDVYPLLEDENPVELVLVMTVEPGFGGQKFMPEMMDKVRTLRKKYPSLDIEVDGGLGPSTIDMAASAGANCIVAGSSVFGASDPAQVITLLRKSVEDSQKTN